MDIVKSDRLNEILKGLHWILLTLLSINDFNFAVILYSVCFVNSFVNSKEWSTPYESSLIYLFPFLIILSFHSRSYIKISDILLSIVFIISLILETILFTEESSYNKLKSRVSSFLLCILFLLGIHLYSFSLSFSIIKFLYYSIGYCILSSVFQAYKLFYTPTEKLDETNTTLV
jgi:hypothetical protein